MNIRSLDLPNQRSLVALATLLFLLANPTAVGAPMLWSSGNGHYYDRIELPPLRNWNDSRSAAEASLFLGSRGYLATITSAAENQFILDSFPASTGIIGRFALGGINDNTWLTGEPFSYSNWTPGEPNSSEENIIQLYIGGASSGQWNDLRPTEQINGFIVEYDPPFRVPEPRVPEPQLSLMLLFGSFMALLASRRRQMER